MRKLINCTLALVLCFLASCAGRMPLVGYDKFGRETTARVNEDKYSDKLAEALVSIQDSAIPALNDIEQEKKWKLRTAVLGFAVNISGGLGPFKVGIKPRLRAAFANGEKPPIP